MKTSPKTGILIHGRHLRAIGWESMVWGDPKNPRLGSLPTAVLAALNEGVPNIAVVTLGTGGSYNVAGDRESEVTQQLFISRFSELEQFAVIKNHPRWAEDKEMLKELVNNAVLDVVTQNTKEEIAAAAEVFRQYGVTRVVEVTGASHAPRCAQLQGMARAEGVIPALQQWALVADDVPYTGSSVADTTVIEAPHRGDDPVLHIPENIRPAKLFAQFYAIPNDQKEAFLEEIAQVVKKYRKP